MGAVVDFVGGLFGGGGSTSYTAPEVPATSLVASTDAKEVDAATMGSDSSNQRKKRGKSSLMIERNTTTSNPNSSGLNI